MNLGLLRAGARWTLDALLPPRCLACGTLVEEPGTLCIACWQPLAFITAPMCRCCGLPFTFAGDDPQAVEDAGGLRCGACVADPPPFQRARAVMVYDEASRGLILAFKHADRTDAAPAFARWLARAAAELVAEADLIVPVPLHRWRLLQRRYNQAALLALALGRISGVAAVPDLLVRRRATPSQGGLSRSGRQRNVAAAFAVRHGRESALTGRRVLLVDDVHTTGATLGECARVLRRAGAAAVDVATLARVAMTVG